MVELTYDILDLYSQIAQLNVAFWTDFLM